MREIKFRAWDTLRKTMFYKDSVSISINGAVHFLETTGEWEVDAFENGTTGNRINLMQFTGLKDKNGKEIYEGDVVKWDDGSNEKYWRVAVCFWDDKQAMFSYRVIKNTLHELSCEEGHVFGGNFYYRDGRQLIVCGNIYENPELI